MAITVALVDTYESATNDNTYTATDLAATTSGRPTLIICGWGDNTGNAAAFNSISGTGGYSNVDTWTKEVDYNATDLNRYSRILVFSGIPSSGGTGNVTVTSAAEVDNFVLMVLDLEGADTSDICVGANVQNNGSGISFTNGPHAALQDSNNVLINCAKHGNPSSEAFTKDANWTAANSGVFVTGENSSLYVQYITGGSDLTCGWSKTGSNRVWVAEMIEVAVASGASAAITGTATPSATESEIVSGGETIIITLTGDTWIAA